MTGGGGYALVEVVPRAWTHLLSVVAGHPIDVSTPTPDGWREYVRERLGRPAPYRLTDGRDPAYRDWSEGYDPGTWLDRTDPRDPGGDLPVARPRPPSVRPVRR